MLLSQGIQVKIRGYAMSDGIPRKPYAGLASGRTRSYTTRARTQAQRPHAVAMTLAFTHRSPPTKSFVCQSTHFLKHIFFPFTLGFLLRDVQSWPLYSQQVKYSKHHRLAHLTMLSVSTIAVVILDCILQAPKMWRRTCIHYRVLNVRFTPIIFVSLQLPYMTESIWSRTKYNTLQLK